MVKFLATIFILTVIISVTFASQFPLKQVIGADDLSLDLLVNSISNIQHSVKGQSNSNSLADSATGSIRNIWNRVKNTLGNVVPSRLSRMFRSLDNQYDLRNSYEAFKNFMRDYGRRYSIAELSERFNLFLSHLSMIEESIKAYKEGRSTYTLSINDYADKTEEELSYLVGKSQYDSQDSKNNSIDNLDFGEWKSTSEGSKQLISTSVPSSKDWRSSGCVGDIREQKTCGACYAFSVAQTIESMLCLRNRTKLTIAPQQVVDCSYGNNGCDGGYERRVIDYYNREKSFALESCYQYESRRLYCRMTEKRRAPNCVVGASIDGRGGELKMKRIQGHDSMIQALATTGPLAGGVHADSNFVFYSKGIFDSYAPRNARQNHALVIVGYGEENGKKFWTLKNSWRKSWGEGGYMRIKRGSNTCAVEDEAFIIYNKPTNEA